MEIVRALTGEDVARAKSLFLEYASSLGFDLCFQGFEEELAGLPGDYAAPSGALLLAIDGKDAAGCAALRRIDDETCEMKRLYVRPLWRGKGLGRALAERIVAEARRVGYARMRLDAIRKMTAAVGLYASMGFKEIAPYRHNPIPEAVYMELPLD
jgi:GNAT superfamily N-acetyltransferase